VRQAGPHDLAQFAGRFQDPRLPEMLFRYRARNYPDTLSDVERERWDTWRREQWAEGDRLQNARSRALALQAERGEQPCLTDLMCYLDRLT
jgi:exodeoxyribonuclease-1